MISSSSILTNKYKKFEMKQMYYSPLSMVNDNNLNNLYGFISYTEDEEKTIYECNVQDTSLKCKCIINKDSNVIEILNKQSLTGFFRGQRVFIQAPFDKTKSIIFPLGTVVTGLNPETMEVIVSNSATRSATTEVEFLGIDASSTNKSITLDKNASPIDNEYAKYLVQIIVNPKDLIELKDCTVSGSTITFNKLLNKSNPITSDFYISDLIIKDLDGDLLFTETVNIISVEGGNVIKLNQDTIKPLEHVTVLIKNPDVLIYERDIIGYDQTTRTITVDKPFDEYPDISTNSKVRIYFNSLKKPLLPNDSEDYIKSVHRNMIYLKKINIGDISPVIDRIDFVKGKKYDYYRSDIDMHEKSITYKSPEFLSTENVIVEDGSNIITFNSVNLTVVPDSRANLDVYIARKHFFYVKNSFSQVFKCLWNNNSVAKEEPVFFPGNYDDKTNIVTTKTDGYKWKYMYTIPANMSKFINDKYMPVLLLEDNNSVLQYGSGGIEAVNIVNNGSNYDTKHYTYSAVVDGDGEGASLKLSIGKDGQITNVLVADPGKNYSYATITIVPKNKGDYTGEPGSGAILKPIISPIGGSGHNLLSELGCEKIMVTSKFSDSENIPTKVNIRQFGILLNPKEISYSGLIDAKKENYVTCMELGITEGTGVIKAGNRFTQSEKSLDETTKEIVTTITFSGTCAHYENGKLYLVNTQGTPLNGKPIVCSTTNITRRVTSVGNSVPNILPFSGDIIYIQNTEELHRDTNVHEFFKIILTY